MELPVLYRTLASCLLVACLASVGGCAWLFSDDGSFRDRSLDYKETKQTKPLDLSGRAEVAQRLNPMYPIPEISRQDGYSATAEQRVPKPKAIIQIVSGEGVRVLRDAGRDWVWLEYPPEQVWPSIKGFFKANNIPLQLEDDAKGFIQTQWLHELQSKRNSFSASAFDFSAQSQPRMAKLAKLRVDITVGAQENSTGFLLSLTEAKFRRGGSLPAVDDGNAWVTTSKKKDVRARIVDELAEYILSEQSYKNSKALVDASDTPRVVLTEDGNGFPVLVLELDFNRAWESIGSKLAEADYEVEDIDRSIGIYFIKNNFLRDAGGDDDQPPELYEIKLDQAERGVQVTVQVNDEELAPINLSQQVLKGLRDLLL